MTNPLTSLDELIWKQFEKVTVAAEKRFGWDKWDLAQITIGAAAVSYLGTGLSTFFTGYKGNNTMLTGLGAIAIVGSVGVYELGRYAFNLMRGVEKAEIKRGTIWKPRFGSTRPFLYLTSLSSICTGIYAPTIAAGKTPPQLPKISVNDFEYLSSLLFLGTASLLFFLTTTSYFITQLPRPPSTKKSLWQALADYVTKPFHNEQQPAEVPISKYVAEQRALLADYLKPQA